MLRQSILRARALRRTTTSVEAKVWRWLRDRRFRDYKFRRQDPIGPFVADFYCKWLRLVIELDGRHHLSDEEQVLYDKRRTRYFEKHGITVLRITNEAVRDAPRYAFERIDAVASELALRAFSR